MKDWWIVAVDYNDGDIETEFHVIHGWKSAVRLYEEKIMNLKEWVEDTGFTGDEGVWLASIRRSLESDPVIHDKEGSFHFEWREETEEGFYLTKESYERLLKEKLELGCEYCRPLPISNGSSSQEAWVPLTDGMFAVALHYQTPTVERVTEYLEIEYCPMCGRKLNGETE